MDTISYAPLAGLVPAAAFFLLWYLAARRLRRALYHVEQQTVRIRELRRRLEDMDMDLAMRDARIARLVRDPTGARGEFPPPLSRTG